MGSLLRPAYVRLLSSSLHRRNSLRCDGVTYCEGALIDTVNFESLLEEHRDLDEIWVSRIVDSKQVRKPKTL